MCDMPEGGISHIDTGGGDFAGRDILTIQNTFSADFIKDLYERFEQERRDNRLFHDVLEEFEFYQRQVSDERVVGLEAKLKAAGKNEELIQMAIELKERYSKKLTKYQLFESAQRINVFLLCYARTQFMTFVYPKIKDKSNDEIVDNRMQQYVINPMLALLKGDTYGFTPDDIHGILYFLTGNCYIKWV